MQNRLGILTVSALLIITLTGCWRKKCCNGVVKEEIHIERTIEDMPCDNCPRIIEDEVEGFIMDEMDEESPATENQTVARTKVRVSGPRGWKQENLK